MTYEYRNVFCEHDFDFGDDVLRNGQIWDMMIYGEGSWCGYGGDVDISPLGDVMVSDGDDRGAQVPPHGLQKHRYHI